ncbi:hypothetical protein ABEB36_013020 [Hypothenemus hampei]|uniref:Transposable element Tc3 transposase n=1 Tax=Hypothenemus hampei TaxID=57062 RepID=A0ABD1E6T2_HYPHA
MPRGTYLTELEKGKILAFSEEQLGLREIARRIGRSHKVVYNFLRNPHEYGTHKKGGPKKKISPRSERRLINLASNNSKSCRVLAQECNLDVSRWTIRRALQKSPHIKRRKMKIAPHLTEQHKARHLEFARENMNRNWLQVVFSDEKKFNLDGPDGFNSYWRYLRREPRYFSKRTFGGVGLMVWGAFSIEGVLPLGFPSFRMNSAEYVGVLENNLLAFFQEPNRNNWLFQQDNARIHVSRETRAWFQHNNIELLQWPACSPDINPMENFWGYLVRKIYPNNKQYDTVRELREAIVHTWNAIEPATIANLINSMDSRIFELIRKNGDVTHY